jgi:hypothetical protein
LREEKVEWVTRDTEFKGGGARNTFYILKVPRQCSLVLLVDVSMGDSKAIGGEMLRF